MAEFVVGANLPWLDYGQDFGASAWRPDGGLAVAARLELFGAELSRLAAAGASEIRLWLLADGRAGLVEDSDGRPLSLDDHVIPDLDAALGALRAAGLRAHLVLTDFLWFSPARVVNGVRLGGRRDHVRDPLLRARLLSQVFEPIAVRYGQALEIAGWDLLNEPEWATFGVGSVDPGATISKLEMRTYLGELAALFHANARQPLSVGLASARWLSLLDGLPLDFVQVHWYETLDSLASLARPVAPSGPGGRAPVLGEFPTRGASVPPSRLIEVARSAGYSGAFAWSSLATDTATDKQACLAALRGFTGRPDPERARA
jgi:hypothetical protein